MSERARVKQSPQRHGGWLPPVTTYILSVLLAGGFPARASEPPAAPFRVTVSQVVPLEWPNFDIFFSIRDRNDRPVSAAALPPGSVRVVPDSVVQSFSPPERGAPISALLIVDKSNSMLSDTADGME